MRKFQVKLKNKCTFLFNKRENTFLIQYKNKFFSICKSNKLTASDVNKHCHLVNGSKFDARTMTRGNYITGAIVKSLKKLVRTSVQRNPDKNNKYIKSAFTRKLRKRLVGKVVKSPKYILAVTKVQVRRLKKKLRFTIVAQPLWRLVDDKQQIYEKRTSLKEKRFTCWLSFAKKFKSTCALIGKKGVLQLRTKKKVRVDLSICRFKSRSAAIIKKNSAYINCTDGEIKFAANMRKNKHKVINEQLNQLEGKVKKIETQVK